MKLVICKLDRYAIGIHLLIKRSVFLTISFNGCDLLFIQGLQQLQQQHQLLLWDELRLGTVGLCSIWMGFTQRDEVTAGGLLICEHEQIWMD